MSNVKFRMPNGEFRMPNSEFRMPNGDSFVSPFYPTYPLLGEGGTAQAVTGVGKDRSIPVLYISPFHPRPCGAPPPREVERIFP